MKIAGVDYSQFDLWSYANNPSNLYYARRIQFTEGPSHGVRAIEVKTAAGMRMLISEERCLDILELSYQEQNIGYSTVNGILANAHSDISDAQGFSRYWSGGFMNTCGLMNTGPANTWEGISYPLHGKIGTMPANQVSIRCENNNFVIQGIVQETYVGKVNLALHRTITIPCDGSSFRVQDGVVNNTSHSENILFAYHINYGFPFLNQGVILKMPKSQVIPRTKYASENESKKLEITKPIPQEEEQCFFWMPEEEEASICVENPCLGLSSTLRYNSKKLPILVEWKCMCAENYALGMNPSTSKLQGRSTELENNYQNIIPPFGFLDYDFEIELNQL